MSDSHGRSITMKKIIDAHPDAAAVIFLGDGADDFAVCSPSVFRARCLSVRGNCDSFLSAAPLSRTEEFGGVSFYITHGHREGVKRGTEGLTSAARNAGCAAALFGHTHVPFEGTADGIRLFNPGAVKNGSFGLIDIRENGILFSHGKTDL